MRRFREWFCRVVLGRTPYHWEDFGGGVKRWGYNELRDDGSEGVFIDSKGGIYI